MFDACCQIAKYKAQKLMRKKSYCIRPYGGDYNLWRDKIT